MRTKIAILLVGILLISCTGCGSSNYITAKNKQMVKQESTNQAVRTDILCKPTNKELFKI